jgi:hypothetical protein
VRRRGSLAFEPSRQAPDHPIDLSLCLQQTKDRAAELA